MKVQFTDTGLIIGSIFGMGAWIALGQKQEVLPILATLLFYLCMANAMSGTGGQRVSFMAVILGAIFGFATFIAMKNLGIALLIFSFMATAYSYGQPKR